MIEAGSRESNDGKQTSLATICVLPSSSLLTLLHGETLLVVPAGDAEDVALPLVAEGVTGDLLRDPLLVEDTAELQEQ